jgi:dolichol-phosphate mannosyltransferase
MRKLSVVIPAYNEEAFIGRLLEEIARVDTRPAGFEKEVIVVDDGSRDRTGEIARAFPGVRVLRQEPNQGKGRAVQRGIRDCTGEFVLVQDGDLEYRPADYLPMLQALTDAAATGAVSVYGSRTWGQFRGGRRLPFPGRHPRQGFGPWLAGVLLTGWTFLLYGRLITDTLTAYKIYPTDVIRGLDVRTHGFETDHEITAKLIRRGVRIREVPIGYEPRSVEEGKKIGPRDGLIAVWTLLRFRFARLRAG